MRYCIYAALIIFFLLFSGSCWADEWKTYHSDKDAISSYTNLKIISSDIRELTDRAQIGKSCVYSEYRINCKTQQWYQVKRAAVLCGAPYEADMDTGANMWFPLNKKNVWYLKFKKLLAEVCSEKKK